MQLKTYQVFKSDDYESLEQLYQEMLKTISIYVEENKDISATVANNKDNTGVIVKVLRLNEYSN